MTQSTDTSGKAATHTLSTKLEEEFIGPLAAIRGVLEILRDNHDLAGPDRARFVNTALRACARLEAGVNGLASNVYAAGERALSAEGAPPEAPDPAGYASRIHFHDEEETADIDFSGTVFDSSATVMAFYDDIEARVAASRRKWYFAVNHTGCKVWPEAWVAFAHRGKRIHVAYSLGTFRYSTHPADSADPEMLPSREEAARRIAHLRAVQG